MPRPLSPSLPKRPLSPSSLRDLSSPTAPLARPASFPAPPTGHDLMSLFPATPPALRDLDILAGVDRPFAEHHNRLSTFQEEVRLRVVSGAYINTSTWFGSQEREFFKGALRAKPWGAPEHQQPQHHRQQPPPPQAHPYQHGPPPAKRRKSVDADAPTPAPPSVPLPTLRLAPTSRTTSRTNSPDDRTPVPVSAPALPQTQARRVPPPTFPPPHSPASPPGSGSASGSGFGSGTRTLGTTSPSSATSAGAPPPAVAASPPSAGSPSAPAKPTPRRRAGKYTKRVFVNPHAGAGAVHTGATPPASSHGHALPPPHGHGLPLPPPERMGVGAGMPPPNLVPVKWGR